MAEEGSKFKYRETCIVALLGATITAVVPVAFNHLAKTWESKPAPSSHVAPTPEPAAPSFQIDQSAGAGAAPMPGAARETPGPTARPEYGARPTPTPFVRSTPPPTPRYIERTPLSARVPEVITRSFPQEPTRNQRYKTADATMNRLFKAATDRMSETERWNFTMEQRNWLNLRTGSWSQGGDRVVIELTEERNKELKRRFGL